MLFTRMSSPPNVSRVRSIDRPDAGLGREVGRHREHPVVGRVRAEIGGRLVEHVGGPGREAHPAPFGRQRACARETEPAARSGDEGDLARELQIHVRVVLP
jgi:hypothetical protein